MHHVALLSDVLLALKPQLSGFLRFLWALDTLSVLIAAVFAAVKGKLEARIMLLGLGGCQTVSARVSLRAVSRL